MGISSDKNNSKKRERKEHKFEEKSNINILNSIKSFFNLIELFSFLKARQKLNIIIYNKHFQEKLGIDINDYKKISEKYIIHEKNGKGREYKKRTNLLIFEGEYLKGKRNGKGKEYYDISELKYEGEYLNGKGNEYYDNENDKLNYEDKNEDEYFNVNVKGKKNYEDAKLKYEGEYLNGKRNGKGKEYYDNGKLKYEGEYLKGKINGKGKFYS